MKYVIRNTMMGNLGGPWRPLDTLCVWLLGKCLAWLRWRLKMDLYMQITQVEVAPIDRRRAN